MPSPTRKVRRRASLWFERVLTAIAAADLGLVVFDLSYIPWRDFYVLKLPAALHETYDRIKGIEPYRDTQQYINRVEDLKIQVALSGLESPPVEAILVDLRQRSIDMIEDNPFQLANKTGNLERIKNQVRAYIGKESAKDAFQIFWSQNHLKQNWDASIAFYERNLQPNLRTNYFRQIGENSEFIDQFWRLDSIFIAFFSVEYLARTWTISRRLGIGWREAMLWRWFDLFLLLPVFRWLRVIPVMVRLDHAEILDLSPLQRQVSGFAIASVASEITETVVIQVLDQLQTSIRQDAIRSILQTIEQQQNAYVDINNVDEVSELSKRLIQVSVYDVLPKIRPDLEALLNHTIFSAVESLPAYQNVKFLPGMQELPKRLSQDIVTQVVGSLYDGMINAIEDPIGAELTQKLTQNFAIALKLEVEKPINLNEIENLLIDFLEEAKVNYVRRASTNDVELVVQETKRLREAADRRSASSSL
ncbi:MAG: hypothetical protein EAZ61_11875 [Oscillatoriales cyanobacterium]|nr:MAG: hypothetical protein EAZ61_11875 [Oscillatoriales cyanobacterium]